MISSDKYRLTRCKMDSGHTKRNISNLFDEELLVCNNDYLTVAVPEIWDILEMGKKMRAHFWSSSHFFMTILV